MYPLGHAPSLFHPFDICFVTDVLREPAEWGKPLPAAGTPVTITAEAAIAHMPNATPNAVGRAVAEFNQINERLVEMNAARKAA